MSCFYTDGGMGEELYLYLLLFFFFPCNGRFNASVIKEMKFIMGMKSFNNN